MLSVKKPNLRQLKLGEKRRGTLVLSSSDRGDDFHETFEKAKPLRICSKTYTRQSSMTVAERNSTCLEEAEEIPQVPQLRLNSSGTFDIKRDCMFFSESAIQDSKAHCDRKRAVSKIETLEFIATVVNLARQSRKRVDQLASYQR